MLYAFGFERVGVVLGDLYFVDPKPSKGQEGAEHGVRLELRVLDRGALKGTIYSATPIDVGRPIWRVDLLESVDGKPGSLDRVHHHPVFRDWDPTNRVFERELSADPLGWLAGKLADLDGVLADADFPADTAGPADAADLRAAAPEIVDAARRLLAKVRDGELGTAPAGTESGTAPGTAPGAEPGTASGTASGAEPGTASGTASGAEPVSVAAGEASGSGEAEPVLARAGWL